MIGGYIVVQTTGLLTYNNLNPSEITSSSRILYTPSSFAKDNLWYIQEIGKLRSLKGHLSKKDTLHSFLYLIVLSGSGKFYYDTTYELNPGTQLFIDCATPYAHESNDSDPWELMWIHFNGSNVKAYYDFYRSQNDSILSYCNDMLTTSHKIDELMSYTQQKTNTYELLTSNGLNSLITNLLLSERLVQTTVTDSDNKLKEIKEYIDKNYTKKLTLEELSELFYISKYHMAREFKRLFGTSIINYQIDCRVTHAKELLRFSDLRIEEIAEQCGITDNSYFNKVFQKTEGMSAREFRKKWRG